MIIPDLNLLIYAYDMRSPYHETSRQWWEAVISGTQDIGIPDVVLWGFIRICTRKSIYSEPMIVSEAISSVEQWLDSPVVRVLFGSDKHMRMTVQMLAEHGAAGNLTTDVQIAAHARINDATIYTNDADFRLFPTVKYHNPLTA